MGYLSQLSQRKYYCIIDELESKRPALLDYKAKSDEALPGGIAARDHSRLDASPVLLHGAKHCARGSHHANTGQRFGVQQGKREIPRGRECARDCL